jgi:hypothetical protein
MIPSTLTIFALIFTIVGLTRADLILCARASDSTDDLAAAGYHWENLVTLKDALTYRDYKAFVGIQSFDNKKKVSSLTTIPMFSPTNGAAAFHLEGGKIIDAASNKASTGAFRFQFRLNDAPGRQGRQVNYIVQSDISCQTSMSEAGFSAESVGEVGIYQLVRGL